MKLLCSLIFFSVSSSYAMDSITVTKIAEDLENKGYQEILEIRKTKNLSCPRCYEISVQANKRGSVENLELTTKGVGMMSLQITQR
jgi:hypothetical protein